MFTTTSSIPDDLITKSQIALRNLEKGNFTMVLILVLFFLLGALACYAYSKFCKKHDKKEDSVKSDNNFHYSLNNNIEMKVYDDKKDDDEKS